MDVENQLSFAQVTQLVVAGVERSGRHDLPLLVGSAGRLKHLGAAGDLLRAAPNFRSALGDYAQSHGRFVRGAGISPRLAGAFGARGISDASAGTAGRESVPEPGRCGLRVSNISRICSVAPREQCCWEIPRPANATMYFRSSLRRGGEFAAEHYGLVYPEAALGTPIPTADAGAHDQLRAAVAEPGAGCSLTSGSGPARPRPVGPFRIELPLVGRPPDRHASAQFEPSLAGQRNELPGDPEDGSIRDGVPVAHRHSGFDPRRRQYHGLFRSQRVQPVLCLRGRRPPAEWRDETRGTAAAMAIADA